MSKEHGPHTQTDEAVKNVLIITGPKRLDYYTARDLGEKISLLGNAAVTTVARDYQVEEALNPEKDSSPDIVIGDGTTYTRDAEGSKVPIYHLGQRRKAKKSGAKYIKFGRSDEKNMKKISKAVQ